MRARPMGGLLIRDINNRFNTILLNLESVRRAKKRYSFTNNLMYTFSVEESGQTLVTVEASCILLGSQLEQ